MNMMSTCSYCQNEVYEDSLACPKCGRAIVSPHTLVLPMEDVSNTLGGVVKHSITKDNKTLLPEIRKDSKGNGSKIAKFL